MVLPSEDFEIAIVVAGFPLLNPKLSGSSSVNTTLAISFNLSVSPVSYTHLTLPTSDLV